MMAQLPSSSSSNCPRPTKKVKGKIQDLVEILINDPVLLDKWSQFCAILECPAQDKLRWDRGIKNGTFHYNEVFSEMLDSWVLRNPYKITVGDLCRVLRGIQCVDVAEKLESEYKTDEIIQQGDNSSTKRNLFLQNGKDIKWPLKHGLSVPTRNFAGRKKQLQQIKINFNSKTNLMLITGFGGIGKTELCRKFAHQICKSIFFRVPSCVWLHGENLETLRESVLKLAGELGITNEGDPPVSEYFEFIASFILGKSSRLVLVIDNVDVIYEEVVKVIQIVKTTKNEKMFVIVTSRDSNILEGAGITVKLDVLSKSKARRMLQSSMSGLEDSDADRLSYLVEYFPLALQQAVAYIKQQKMHFRTPHYSVTDYVNEFELKKSEMLDHELNRFEFSYSKTTLVTWDMTICKISEGTVEILKIIAFLDPDGVELKFLEEVCIQMGVVDFDGGLDMLNSYCLVKIIEDYFNNFYTRSYYGGGVDKGVSVHRLVQEVMRGRVGNEDYIKILFDTLFLVLWKLFENRFYFSRDVHLKNVYKFAWKCEMREIEYFGDALFFLLDLDRIECAEKLTKLEYPYIQFYSEFGIEKREFLEKVLLWCFVCQDSRRNSEEIAKGEFNLDWRLKDEFYSIETVEGCLQISQKYFNTEIIESSKISFVLKNLLARNLAALDDFDRALLLCEELATFPFEDDDGQAYLLYKTILFILLTLQGKSESFTPSQLASLNKILNKINDPIQWKKLLATWCYCVGDNKKALEFCSKLVQETVGESDNSKNSSAKRNGFLQNGKVNWPLKHGLFVPTENFTGREEQLEEIQTNFESKNNLMLITGFGGIGKTELCRKFAHKICEFVIFRVPSCVWLHGENLKTLRVSVLKLAAELGISNEDSLPVSEYFEYIVSFVLEKSSRLLLVIDNVDVCYEEVEKVIKIVKMTKNEKMFVIVTSRDSNILEGAGITMKLDVLSKLQARRMLQSSMSGLSDSDAEKLSYLVEYFPLALQQAVAYIKQHKENFRTPTCSVTGFVNEYEVKKGQILDQKLNKFEHNYSMTSLVTWDMTFRKLSEGAIEILKIIAYLDGNRVELEFLEKICTQMGVVDFEEGLNMLNSYCLAKTENETWYFDEIEKVISVHRLVQEVMREKVDNETIRQYAKTLFDSLFLVRWQTNDLILFSYDVHLDSVFKFAWKCEMRERVIRRFGDALFFLLDLDRIDCAEKLTKLEFPHIQFSSEFGVEKREFLENVLLWLIFCGDSSTNSKEIAKGEFNLDCERVPCVDFIHEGCLQMSEKYFDESSKITFALKSLLVRDLVERGYFDLALELCEELATFPFEDDDRQADILYKTIHYILFKLEQEYESCTPSQLASLEKIVNKIVKNNPNDSIKRIKLEALFCDLKGDYKKALELFFLGEAK